jgi:tripartite-type tricarboxylate transporter receptor subunit TctC
MQEVLGQPVIIDNKGGNAGMIGLEFASRQPGDGYTIVLGNTGTIAINQSVYPKMNYDALKDFVPIGITTTNALMATIAGNVPANNIREFVAYAKANPGKLNFAISGAGSGPHFGAEMFKRAAGLDIPVVFYKGSGPVLTDLLGGQVQVTFDNLPSSIAHIKAGKLHALAVTTAQRSEELPDVPTVAETVPGFEASAFFGFGVPKGTPKEIVELLNKEVNLALRDPAILAKLKELGGTPIPGSAADFGKVVADETAKWEKVVNTANLSVN